jgi:hypothetical protein
VPIHVGINDVLSGSSKGRKGGAEVVPVLRRVHLEERNTGGLLVVNDPPESKLAGLARNQVGDDRPMTRDHNVEVDLGLALDANDFLAVLGLHPTLGREVFTLVIELLDVDVFNRRPQIGEAPGDVPVVSNDHVRHARKGHADDIEVSADEVGFVPRVRQAQIEVHVIRQERLAGDGVSAGDGPVV